MGKVTVNMPNSCLYTQFNSDNSHLSNKFRWVRKAINSFVNLVVGPMLRVHTRRCTINLIINSSAITFTFTMGAFCTVM